MITKKTIFRSFLVFLLIVSTYSCKNKNEFSVSGNIKNGNGKWIKAYKLTSKESVLFDSAQINSKEKFVMENRLDEITFFRLNVDKNNYFFLIVEPGEKIRVEADYNALQSTYVVSGSYNSDILRDYMKQFEFAYKEKITIAEQYRRRIESGEDVEKVRQESIARHELMKKSIRNFTKEYIRKNKCLLPSILILDLQLGPEDPILTMTDNYEYFAMVDSCLSEKYARLELVQAFDKALIQFNEKKELNRHLKLKIGTMAPEIALPDTSGDTILLSSLKGKYVLLDFWASWNKTSISYNKELIGLYPKYQPKGFEIYQVSLDNSKASWISAIDKYGLPWINVSDLKFWNSYVVNLYQVYSIPSNFLIDPNGKIISINIETDELDEKLSSVFIN